MGRPKLLSDEDEASLDNYVEHMAKTGHGLSTKMLVAMAGLVLKKRKHDARSPTIEWARQYIKRNNLSTR